MKKFAALLLAVALLFTVACVHAEDMRAFYNPNNYPLLRVTDAFMAEDDSCCLVQGTFGDIDTTVEWDAEWIGFDKENTFTLVLADDAVIEMPADIYSIEDNVPADCAAVIAFADANREEFNNVDFYCEFEMNEEGVLTKLVYCFYPY